MFGDKALKKTAIYAIIRKVKLGKNPDDQRHLSAKKTKRTAKLIAAVGAAIKADPQVTLSELAADHGVAGATIHRVIHEDLGLVKRVAGWVAKKPRKSAGRGYLAGGKVSRPSLSPARGRGTSTNAGRSASE